MAEPAEFTLTDAQGESHEYMITPHAASDGTRLCLRIMAMAGEPLGRLVSGNLGELIELFKSGEIDLDGEIDKELAKLKDLDVDLGATVRDIQAAIAEAGDEKFFRSLLRHTYRDGDPVHQEHNFDRFYQANYLELFQAVWKSVQVNGFLGFWGIS